jgi:hypothetical protein
MFSFERDEKMQKKQDNSLRRAEVARVIVKLTAGTSPDASPELEPPKEFRIIHDERRQWIDHEHTDPEERSALIALPSNRKPISANKVPTSPGDVLTPEMIHVRQSISVDVE